MEDNVAIRLKLFMNSIGISNSEFADYCGIARPTLSQLLTGRNKKVSDVLVGQIHAHYPDLSIVWLLFGEGDMLVRNNIGSSSVVGADIKTDGLLPTLGHEEGIFRTSGQEKVEYGKEKALNMAVKESSDRINKEKESNLETLILKREIEKLKENPRKVVQITVYYDDSTFETFYPGNIK